MLQLASFEMRSTRLMFSMILQQNVAKAFILSSFGTTHDSQPYRRMVTQVVSNSLIFVSISKDGFLQRHSNFQNAAHASAFFVFRSAAPHPIMKLKYLKSVIWLMGLPQTSSRGCGSQLAVTYSVLGALITSPRSAAAVTVLVSCAWARVLGMIPAGRHHLQNPSHSSSQHDTFLTVVGWSQLQRRFQKLISSKGSLPE